MLTIYSCRFATFLMMALVVIHFLNGAIQDSHQAPLGTNRNPLLFKVWLATASKERINDYESGKATNMKNPDVFRIQGQHYHILQHITQNYKITTCNVACNVATSFFNTRMRICSPGMVDRALLQFMKREPLPPARPLRKPSRKSTSGHDVDLQYGGFLKWGYPKMDGFC